MKVSHCLNNLIHKIPYSSTHYKLYIFILMVLIILIIYSILGHLLCSKNISTCDLLNKSVIKFDTINISWWPISHFIMFFIIGMLFPQALDAIIIIISIGWEIVETLIGIIAGTLFPDSSSIESSSPSIQYTKWLKGSWTDIIFNLSGFYLGRYLRTGSSLRS